MASSQGTEGDSGFDVKLYRYTPSLGAAIVSVVVFAVLTILHAWKPLRARAQIRVVMLMELYAVQAIGYCGRIWSHYDTLSVGGFVLQAILILVAPALYAASIYMILGRLIRTLRAQHLSLIRAGGGGVQSGGTLDLYNSGEKIIIAGLFCQICVFGFFMITAILFHRRISKAPTRMARRGGIPWQRYLYVLYIASFIIMIRSVFRVVEYLQGNSGYLISHEIFLYIFDTILMAAVMFIFLIWYVEQLSLKKKTHWRQRQEDSDGDGVLKELSQGV
ncbi:RTA1 like protein-domain-containing protein [Fusarium redolens]|uniref:RTA1 like protein-domain-containing protein n=1 Tax=Fusarium redolens TaxID=48865 RepID=A0A9P9JK71_FUSRE|nr:RTA1 like protein-domain-containing protein [Fusarium redolens]KAH7205790.1 RTA1 like protein-domain-containing protein [Fusarium redolens]